MIVRSFANTLPDHITFVFGEKMSSLCSNYKDEREGSKTAKRMEKYIINVQERGWWERKERKIRERERRKNMTRRLCPVTLRQLQRERERERERERIFRAYVWESKMKRECAQKIMSLSLYKERDRVKGLDSMSKWKRQIKWNEGKMSSYQFKDSNWVREKERERERDR